MQMKIILQSVEDASITAASSMDALELAKANPTDSRYMKWNEITVIEEEDLG